MVIATQNVRRKGLRMLAWSCAVALPVLAVAAAGPALSTMASGSDSAATLGNGALHTGNGTFATRADRLSDPTVLTGSDTTTWQVSGRPTGYTLPPPSPYAPPLPPPF
jgi:hypothetical protein